MTFVFWIENSLHPQQVSLFTIILFFLMKIFKFKRVLKHSPSKDHHTLLLFEFLYYKGNGRLSPTAKFSCD